MPEEKKRDSVGERKRQKASSFRSSERIVNNDIESLRCAVPSCLHHGSEEVVNIDFVLPKCCISYTLH